MCCMDIQNHAQLPTHLDRSIILLEITQLTILSEHKNTGEYVLLQRLLKFKEQNTIGKFKLQQRWHESNNFRLCFCNLLLMATIVIKLSSTHLLKIRSNIMSCILQYDTIF